MIHIVCLALFAGAPDLAEIGRIRDGDLEEVSGIVASRAYPGVFWVHNDSGNRGEVYAVETSGRVVSRVRLPFPNVDWEDVAIDDRGRLYLADTGNNYGRLPLRAVYRFDETNPLATKRTRVGAFSAYFYRFAPGDPFDCEALFVEADVAYLVTKRTDGRPARLVSIPTDRPISPLAPVTPRPEGELPDFREPVTGADLSRDGLRLAVCSDAVVRVYRREPPGGAGSKPGLGRLTTVAEVRYKERAVEAVAWDGADLILADEPGRIHRVPESEWRARPPRPADGGNRR